MGQNVPLVDYTRKKGFMQKVFGKNERGYYYEA